MLLTLVLCQPFHRFIPVNLMRVKLGSVHTGKFDLAADGQSASPAHSRAVNHNGIHAYDGFNAVFLVSSATARIMGRGPIAMTRS